MRNQSLTYALRAARPAYFERVRRQAHERWNQLKADPELAGPWYQLFQQLCSDPRHVLSELLQNADDAGATWARISIKEGVFLFEHNGRDFDECDFRSLCRFAFSNKRSLHTIGYRGIGFKTTFSLSHRVEILTPSLAVAFENDRFTEPIWLPNAKHGDNTCIRIAVSEANRVEAVQDSLLTWSATALPILFFRNLQELDLGGIRVAKQSTVSNLVPHCNEVRLITEQDRTVYAIQSVEEPFPPEAMEEIREERRDAAFELPPVHVTIVLNAPDPQRLYVVLPTGVALALPFSCNAPFLQDPARTGIKSPSTSPTNRWLLQRIGQLAGQAFVAWLSNSRADQATRASAYKLFLPYPSSRR